MNKVGAMPNGYIQKLITTEGVNRYNVQYEKRQKTMFTVVNILLTGRCLKILQKIT